MYIVHFDKRMHIFTFDCLKTQVSNSADKEVYNYSVNQYQARRFRDCLWKTKHKGMKELQVGLSLV